MQWEKEVVVITGGKRGLGGVLAEVLGLRGVSVAVLDLDVTGEEEGEGGGQGRKGDGVRYWRCDVGNLEEVERVWEKVVKDVGFLFFFFVSTFLPIHASCSYDLFLYMRNIIFAMLWHCRDIRPVSDQHFSLSIHSSVPQPS